MARPGLMRHRKFLRLATALGSDALARGHLEMLWESAYECGDDRLGDADDVEAQARWRGERGVLCAALFYAGGASSVGFIEVDADGIYFVHDLWDHAPDYVAKRAEREAERMARGKTLSDIRSEAGKKGAAALKAKKAATASTLAGLFEATDWQLAPTRAPARAPAPAQEEVAGASLAALRQEPLNEVETEPLAGAEDSQEVVKKVVEVVSGIDEPKKRKSESDARHAPLVKRLVEVAQETDPGWRFNGGRDAKVVSQLLASNDPAEIESRWRRARMHVGFPRVGSLSDLLQHWGHFPLVGPSPPVRDVGKGYARADEQDWSGDGGYGAMNRKPGGE